MSHNLSSSLTYAFTQLTFERAFHDSIMPIPYIITLPIRGRNNNNIVQSLLRGNRMGFDCPARGPTISYGTCTRVLTFSGNIIFENLGLSSYNTQVIVRGSIFILRKIHKT